MKIFMTSVCVLLSLNAMTAHAAGDSFENQASTLNAFFGMTQEQDQTRTLQGKTAAGADCQVTVYNKTAIDPTFPESSKLAQQIQVALITKEQGQYTGDKFTLSRDSQVSQFDLQKNVGSATLLVTANNLTGIANRRMKQQIKIVLGSNAEKTLDVMVKGFSGDSYDCKVK